MKVETVPCKMCDTPTTYLGTELCGSCWEVMRRVEKFAKSKAGRKHLRQMLRPYNPFAIWFEVKLGSLYIHTRYWVLELMHPRDWRWDWGGWRPKIAPAKNWTRGRCWFPIGTFDIKGFLFWGKRPEDGGPIR